MAKSKIINEFINENISLKKALKRAYLIAKELGNQNLICWVEKELFGYQVNDVLPDYRLLNGILKGSYVTMNSKVSNVNLPLNIFEERIPEDFFNYSCFDGISIVESLTKSKDKASKSLIELTPFIKDKRFHFFSLYLQIPSIQFNFIIDSVTKKLIDFFIAAEKKFGNLDNFDIENKEKDISEFNKYLSTNFNFISIGDNNKITKSQITE